MACITFHAMLHCIAGAFELSQARLESYLTRTLHFRAIGQAVSGVEIDRGGCRRTPRQRAKRDRRVVLRTIFLLGVQSQVWPRLFPSSSLRNGCQL